MEGVIGTVMMFGGNFAPRTWTLCQGQLASISQNQALFSILGTTYGGDGRTTFGYPDLRGRGPIGSGNGPGLTPAVIGQRPGQEYKTLNILEIPQHNHTATFNPTGSIPGQPITATATATVNAANGVGSQDDAEGAYWARAQSGSRDTSNGYAGQKNTTMAADAVTVDVEVSGGGGGITGGTVNIGLTGGSQSFSLRQPSLCINHVMCLTGVYPSRN